MANLYTKDNCNAIYQSTSGGWEGLVVLVKDLGGDVVHKTCVYGDAVTASEEAQKWLERAETRGNAEDEGTDLPDAYGDWQY